MALEQAFSLTPRESYLYTTPGHRALVHAYGVTHFYKANPTYRFSFDHQHASDEHVTSSITEQAMQRKPRL